MSNKQLALGLILILIGMIFLLQTLDLIWISFGDLVQLMFPLGLIGLGGWLIVRKRRQEMETPPPDDDPLKRAYQQPSSSYSSQAFTEPPPVAEPVIPPQSPSPPPPPPPGGPEQSNQSQQQNYGSSRASSYSGSKTKYSNFFGDLDITCDHIDMRNVEVSAFLGDIEVLLRQAKLEQGLSRMVISGFIGDIRIMVPQGMAVFASGSNFIGNLDLLGRRSDGFGNSLDGQTENYSTSDKKLYIAINTFIGDVRVVEV